MKKVFVLIAMLTIVMVEAVAAPVKRTMAGFGSGGPVAENFPTHWKSPF